MNQNEIRFVNFLSNEDFLSAVVDVTNVLKKAKNDADKKIYSNVLDPFSAIFEAVYFEMDLSEWIEKEKSRQTQKSMQNKIGEFHQRIIGCVDGWENYETGYVVDVINKEKKVVAEIKNKFNTTKGNHKKTVYDDLERFLEINPGYTAYCVEIIPQGAKRYNKPFVPPDNVSKQRRNENEKIRVIDGYSFYELVTGETDALIKLYRALPEAIAFVSKTAAQHATHDKHFDDLFKRAFGVDIS